MEATKKTDTNKQTCAFHRFTDYQLQAGKVKKTPKAGGHRGNVQQIKTKLK